MNDEFIPWPAPWARMTARFPSQRSGTFADHFITFDHISVAQVRIATPVKISPDLQSTHPATYFLLACTVLANIAWFSDRAVFIDENLFLGVARMTRDMGILASGDWLFFGGYTPLAAHTHSPFGEYCLALLLAL